MTRRGCPTVTDDLAGRDVGSVEAGVTGLLH